MFTTNICIAQSNSRRVVDSPITQRYRDAVKAGFYREVNSYITTRYHGFVDAGYTFGIGDYDFGKVEISSTHGYQFNSYFFLGGGIAFHFISEYETPDMTIALDYRKRAFDIPLYANTRITFLKGCISPFIDAKGGYYLTHHGELYVNISIGCRFAIQHGQAINIYIGYTKEDLEFKSFGHFSSSHDMSYTRYSRVCATEGISVKVGYEF